MNTAIAALLRSDLVSLSRSRWLILAIGAGILGMLVIAITSSGVELQRNSAALFSLGGLAVALGLGAPALVRDLERGTFGLSASAGASLTDIAWGRLLSRSIGLAVVLGLWALTAVTVSIFGDSGTTGDLSVHFLLTGLVFVMLLLAAAGAATLMGTVAGGIFGIAVLISAQAVVNLKAAADQGFIGTAGDVIQAAYWFLPRNLVSPMISDLQRADQGGPVAPQFEINGNITDIPASGLDSVLWTIAWCGLFFGLAIVGLRRREL